MRQKLLFINRSYWPDAEATGQLLTELCEDLAGEFDVTVIAGQPNQNPGQLTFQRSGVEQRHGVAICRVWHTRLPKRWFIGRALNYVTFFAAASLAAICRPKFDLVVVETDPPLLALLGSWLKHNRDCQLIVYLQDIYPDIAVALGLLRRSWYVRQLRSWLFGAYLQAERVVVLSDDMRAVLTESHIPNSLIVTIPNWVDTTLVVPQKTDNAFRRQYNLEGKFVVMYSGNLGLSQQLDNLLLAAETLRTRSDICFMLVGQGASKPRLKKLAAELELTNVIFVDYQAKRDLSISLSAADVHVVPVDGRITGFMMPSKLYGILASGTPVIAVAPENCELARLVREEQIGRVVPPGCPHLLAEQIQELCSLPNEVQLMGEIGRQLAISKFDRKSVTRRFSALLDEVGRARRDERFQSSESTGGHFTGTRPNPLGLDSSVAGSTPACQQNFESPNLN